MLQRLLDVFATRLGVVLTVGLGCGLCLCAGLYFQFGANRLLASHEMFRQNQMRDSFVTMSDLSRLTLIVEKMAIAGELTPDLEGRFLRALDILYVRADTIKTREHLGSAPTDGPTPSETIFSLIDYVDDALARGIDDFAAFKFELLQLTEVARGRLVNFQDNLRRQEDRVLTAQAEEVKRQARVMGVSFLLVGLMVFCALILLHKEILARNARSKAEARANYLAFFDPLTGLPNRVQFADKMAEQLAAKRPIAIMVIDLDGFKAVNDTHGHAAGDAVLQGAAQTIGGVATAQHGFSARLSGDEFAICLPVEDIQILGFIGDALLEGIQMPIDYEGGRVSVGGSIGIATGAQLARSMELTAINLMRAGDFALYASKEAGKNTFTIFNDALEAKFNARRGMLADLEHAIAGSALQVFLQPKVLLPEGVPYGFEALVRWQRGDTFVPPDLFVGLAEEAGLVTDIDLFVLNRATERIAQHNMQYDAQISVSVNLSAMHFNTPDIVAHVRRALERSGLDPPLLTLEVTETVQIQDWERVRLLLSQLSALGCKISIDDFGSGYSSLAYLRNMVADELKVDRSLVDGITTSKDSRHVLQAIVDLGTGLGMRIVIEGVETEEQSHTIQTMGCVYAQGYLYGKPLAAERALNAILDVAAPKKHSNHGRPADSHKLRNSGRLPH